MCSILKVGIFDYLCSVLGINFFHFITTIQFIFNYSIKLFNFKHNSDGMIAVR